MNIQLRDGLKIQTSEIEVSADATVHDNSDCGIISHAHADHIPSGLSSNEYICSKKTYELVNSRKRSYEYKTDNEHITQHKAGHIPGSRCFTIHGDKDILYTGDFSVRDRMHLEGFNPPEADILITESTYGNPRYVFDDQEKLESNIVSWFEQNRGNRIVCKGYSLGRAQEIEILARRAGFENILVNKATMKMNRILSDDDMKFSTKLYEDEFARDTILISSNSRQVRSFSDERDIKTANFTGWAHDGRYQKSERFDRSFVLTDHADFSELIETVESVNPDMVYTLHGYKDRLAEEITKRLSIDSQALRNNQTTIGDFQ